MTNVAIRASDVGKHFYRVHEKPMLLREAAMLFSGRRRRVDDLWAVRHVTFDLHEGETLGVLGPNGSGKSTLLTVVAGTAYPNEGTISTRGRISTLLSLGAGFHPDMTGEENIITSAGLLGIPVEEARRRMTSIVEFAELESVIDTQIRHYSSGMMARLGFAIAIHVSPNILVIDEVFAVGDIAFQTKCLDALRELKSRGITILFASQAPLMVAEFCSRALWLEGGTTKMLANATEVAEAYQVAMTGRTIGEEVAEALSHAV
ncbi:MAG TPA: ABC transporter ATP-binding protein [Polyangiaceae bacterium]|jgi:ABC-2 type transport system ATP-binding protein|nr:ABC transporter ATP-binding protein [Polyangiaceae bacterium]